MKLAQIAVFDEEGTMVYEGGLREFLRDNAMVPRELTVPLHARTSVEIGGGAAPAFYVALVS